MTMGDPELTLVPLKRFEGHGRRTAILVLGNVSIIAMAAVTYELVAATHASIAVRAVATLGAGALVLMVMLWVYWATARSVPLRLFVSPNGVGILGRHPPTRPCPIDRLTVRRLAYLPHEGGAGHPHVMALEIGGLARRPLIVCAPKMRGGWPELDGHRFRPPQYELEPEHWTLLCAMLGLASQTPSTPQGRHEQQ